MSETVCDVREKKKIKNKKSKTELLLCWDLGWKVCIVLIVEEQSVFPYRVIKALWVSL